MTDAVTPPFDLDSGYPPRDERVPLQRKISLKFKEFRGFVTEFSDNLSLGGMFIRTTTPAPVGTVFDFEFSLEEGDPLIHGIGQVIWVRERDEGFDHPAGIGVRFLFVDPDGRQLVERMVADRLAGGAPITEIELGPAATHRQPLSPAPIGVAETPQLGSLDFGGTETDESPWILDSPPLDNKSGPIEPLLPTPRRTPGRGAVSRSSRSPKALWKIVAALAVLLALGALGWYGATLLGLVGEREPETVPVRAIPVPGPTPQATLPKVEPPPDRAPAEPVASADDAVEPAPSATTAEPVVPAADPNAVTTEEQAAASDAAAARPGRRGRAERHFKTIESITWQEHPDGIDVVLTADGKVEEWDYTVLHLTDPPRELVKIENVDRGFSATNLPVGSRDLPRIRIGFHETPGGNELHVVLDLATPSVRLEHTNAQGREIRLTLVGPR